VSTAGYKSQGLASRHLDTGFPWFYSVLQQILSRYPKCTLHCIHLSLPSNTHSSPNALIPSLCVTLPSPNFPALYSICRLIEREGRAGTAKDLQSSTFCILPPSLSLSLAATQLGHTLNAVTSQCAACGHKMTPDALLIVMLGALSRYHSRAGCTRCVYSAATTTLHNYHSRNATKNAGRLPPLLLFVFPQGTWRPTTTARHTDGTS
jgi:hypothetical protein